MTGKRYSILIASILLIANGYTGFAQKSTPPHRMDYHLSWNGKSTVLSIDLLYHSNGKDSTVFVYGNPTPGGLNNIFAILQNVKADAKDLVVIHPASRKVVVVNKTQGLKKLHYEIDGKLYIDTKRARPNEAFRPTIGPGFLYTLGYNLFLDVADKAYTHLSVVWDRYPKGMPYFISSAPEALPNVQQILPIGERNSLLLQMNENLIIEKHVVNTIPNYLLTSRSDNVNDMQHLMQPFMNTFIPQLRDFWQDYKFDFYFVSMIPLLNDVPSTMTGIGLVNGFGTRYIGPLDTEKIETIAHEVSHTWIGGRLQFNSVTMENEWFNEGFNDYIAVYSLAKAGMFSDSTFLKYVNNEVFEKHYTNPHNTLSGDSIEKYFWTGRNFEKIPYHRGFIYAFYLDNQIRLATEGKQTIRDFLVHLLKQNQQNNLKTFTKYDFAEAAKLYFPKEQILEEINTYMLEGKLLDFHYVKLTPGFSVEYKQNIPQIRLTEGSDLKKIYK